ncbi:DUF2285 domain-containing protein [Mesorhizobium sp. USDA-HM6]|nr:DUF2285 domain-containing protein [Mesorhizobium sp. USDA-HM6]
MAPPCHTTLLIPAEGAQHVLLEHAGRQLQLAVSGASVLSPVFIHAHANWPAAYLRHRLWALECLNALNAHGQLPRALFPPEARCRRLRFVLRALDGSLAEASYRGIAEVLVGQARVRADWTDPRDHLRDRIRRAIRRGRALMNGGYIGFLI